MTESRREELPGLEQSRSHLDTSIAEIDLQEQLSNLYQGLEESLPTREALARDSRALLAFARLSLEEPGANKNEGDQPVPTARGMQWRKGENGWELFDSAGKRQDRYSAEVESVSRGDDGRTIVKLKDGRTVHELSGGGSLEFNKEGKLSKITDQGGATREIFWDGDQIKAVRVPSGLWNRVRSNDGSYKDEWLAENSKTTTGWPGKIEVDQATGDYSLIATQGEGKGTRITYKIDESEERRYPDGSRDVKFKNTETLKFDKDGNPVEFKDAEGVIRRFGWEKNPDARGQDDQYRLKTVHVIRPDGKQYYHQRGEGDKWTVQRLGNNQWSAAEAEALSFAVDRKTGAYSYTEGGVETKMIPGVGKEFTGSDGAKLQYDKDDNLTKAVKGDKSREFIREGGKLAEIRDGITGQVWKPSESGVWQSTSGARAEGAPVVEKNGDYYFEKDGRKTVVKMDGTQSQRVDNADKSTLDKKDGLWKLASPDGSSREYKLDGTEVVAETRVRNGKSETWTRKDRNPDGSYVWENDKGDREDRQAVRVTDRGEFVVEYKDGRKYTGRTDGSERLEHSKEQWHIEFKGGKAAEIQFADGTLRKFTYEGDSNSPKTITVIGRDGARTDWTKIGKDQYKNGSGTVWNAKVEVTREGKYSINDLDSRSETVRVPQGIETTTKGGVTVERFKGEIRRISGTTVDVEVARDENNKITELRDRKNNTLYKKDGDEFKVSALDESKPFVKPDEIARKGEAQIDEKGTVVFKHSDGTLLRHELGKAAQDMSTREGVDSLIRDSRHLTAEQKRRFQASLDKMETNPAFSAAERKRCFAELSQLLLETSESSQFNLKDMHDLAEQSAWLIANPTRNEQGANPTCQVTDIRTCVLMEKPSHFLRMMKEVAITGKFKTADGTVIDVPKSSLARGTGTEEATFPPEPGTRAWAGKIWDITTANVFWQRQTRTPKGEVVKQGAITFEQERPSGRRDGGARLYKNFQKEDGSWWRQELTASDGTVLNHPEMSAANMMDAYKQITGEDQADRMIVHKRVGVSGNGLKVVDSENDLHEALQKGPWPKIIQIHTSHPWVYSDSNNGTAGGSGGREGGEHVVVITGYDPRTGKVSVDNSWSPGKDRLSADRQISLRDLHNASKGKYVAPAATGYYMLQNGRYVWVQTN